MDIAVSFVTYANRVDCEGRSYRTYSRYISDYRRFIEGTRFEKKVITKIKASDIHNFCESITGSGEEYSVQTIKNLKTITNYVFDCKNVRDFILHATPSWWSTIHNHKVVWCRLWKSYKGGKGKSVIVTFLFQKQPKICFVGNTNYEQMPMKIPLFSALPMV